MAASTPSSPSSSPTFETALAELERIVQSMESGEATLDESLAHYERGMNLLRYCQEQIATAEQKIRLLEDDRLRDFAPGQNGDA